MDIADWIGLLGGIGGIAGGAAALWSVSKIKEANRISRAANDIARDAMNLQVQSDRLLHAASLVLLPDFAGIDDRQPRRRFIKVPMTNLGSADAYDVTVRLRRKDSDEWHSTDGPNGVPAGERRDFRLPIRQDFFREYESGTVIDYCVTYKDRLDHHEKWFRVEMSGMWETNWSFRLLDIKLDGTRVSVPNAPRLAPGIAFEEDQSSL